MQKKDHIPQINKLDGSGKMTRFERAKLLGLRATQLEQGEMPKVPTTIHDTVFTIAEREFN
jgi:DNA-directed RNA polymerase subunit K/omega